MYLANMMGFTDVDFREEVEKVCEVLKAGKV